MKMINSLTGKPAKSLMSNRPRTRKVKLLVFGATMEEKDRNGKSFILTKLKVHRLRDLTKTMDSM